MKTRGGTVIGSLRWPTIAAAIFVLTGFLGSNPSGAEAWASEPVLVGSLGAGEAIFWEGPFIENATVGDGGTDAALCRGLGHTMFSCAFGLLAPSVLAAGSHSLVGPLACRIPQHPCFDFAFDVEEPGAVLRVALDHPSSRDVFAFEVRGPDGQRAAQSFPNNQYLSKELYVTDPFPGRWTVRVVALNVIGSGFRMRARLDALAAADPQARAQVPNLRTIPPFEFVFGGCQASEVAFYAAVRCLRFSTGPAETGSGTFELRIKDTGRTGTLWQRVHSSDGSFKDREAGTYEFHAAHGHYHSNALGELKLYRIIDEVTGQMVLAGTSPKLTFCLGDIAVTDWRSFDQDRQGSAQNGGDCVSPPGDVQIAMTRGWAELYLWFTEGNFVDFGSNPNGRYILQSATDPHGEILETDEFDNSSYAYIEVTGETISVLERGLGSSPWDAAKVVATDGRRGVL